MNMLDRYGEEIPEHNPQDVIDCGLCDDDGYRGSVICDHKDHATAAKRGMAKIREAMGWT